MLGAYLIGEPGAGKSTLAAELTKGVEAEYRPRPMAHVLYLAEGRVAAAQIGGEHPTFPGTDRLSMSVQPRAIEWLEGAPAPVVWGEGDRLSTAGWLTALDAACDEWWLVLVATPPEVAAERRARRGSAQSETWLAGRRTKVHRLAERFAGRLVELDGAKDPASLAADARRLPAFAWAGA